MKRCGQTTVERASPQVEYRFCASRLKFHWRPERWSRCRMSSCRFTPQVGPGEPSAVRFGSGTRTHPHCLRGRASARVFYHRLTVSAGCYLGPPPGCRAGSLFRLPRHGAGFLPSGGAVSHRFPEHRLQYAALICPNVVRCRRLQRCLQLIQHPVPVRKRRGGRRRPRVSSSKNFAAVAGRFRH
jgi:hypothetical protein